MEMCELLEFTFDDTQIAMCIVSRVMHTMLVLVLLDLLILFFPRIHLAFFLLPTIKVAIFVINCHLLLHGNNFEVCKFVSSRWTRRLFCHNVVVSRLDCYVVLFRWFELVEEVFDGNVIEPCLFSH